MPVKENNIIPFGAHKGKQFKQVPTSYLIYIYENYNLDRYAVLLQYLRENIKDLKILNKVETQDFNHNNYSKNGGRIVKTKTGLLGRTYNRDSLHDGKVKVYVLDEDENVKMSNGKPLKMLCRPDSLQFLGFID